MARNLLRLDLSRRGVVRAKQVNLDGLCALQERGLDARAPGRFECRGSVHLASWLARHSERGARDGGRDERAQQDGRKLIGLSWRVLGDERRQTAEFLRILATIDRRKIYRDEGFSSTFKLCTDGYHLTRAQAWARLASARAGRRFPVVFDMIARGEIHMTGLAMLEKHLTPENHQAVLQQAVHKTKDQIGELVASLAPKPDAKPSIRPVPQPQPQPPQGNGAEPDRASAPSTGVDARGAQADGFSGAPATQPEATPREQPAPASTPVAPQHRDQIEPRSPDRYMLRFMASKRCTELLQQAKDLMSHRSPNVDVGELTEAALELLVQDLLRKKHKVTDRPRKPRKVKKAKKESRHIPAHVKREVWARDGGCCSYVAANGRRCCETRLLEYDHIVPKAHGGTETADNLRLRCRAHKQLTAEHVFGEAHMTLSAQGFRPVSKDGVQESGSPGRTKESEGASPPTPVSIPEPAGSVGTTGSRSERSDL